MGDATDDPKYFKVDFQNSVIRMNELLKPGQFPEFLTQNPTVIRYENKNPLFLDMNRYDFTPDTLSVARGIALPLPGISDDLTGRLRDPVHPDAGAYEF